MTSVGCEPIINISVPTPPVPSHLMFPYLLENIKLTLFINKNAIGDQIDV